MCVKHISKIIFICIYTLLFSVLFYVGKEIFFPSHHAAEQYIEPGFSRDEFSDFSSFSWVSQEEVNAAVHTLIYQEFRDTYIQEKKSKVDIRYIPKSLYDMIESSYLPLVEVFLYDDMIFSKIKKLRVILYQNMADTRGRMRGWNIHMYGVPHLNDGEFLSVLIHEFAHYYDIYTLAGNAFWDLSQEFYTLSWDSVTTIKKGQDISNFVSGYAATNQYEDFAESYTYYVLHNEEFLSRAKENLVLMKKYNFFSRYIFPANQFTGKAFSTSPEEERDYIWDITKIEIEVKKFLQYLKDTI